MQTSGGGGGGSIMVWGVFCLNMSLTGDSYIVLFREHLYAFIDTMYPNNDVLFHALCHLFPRISLENILKPIDEWCGHHIHMA